MENWNLYWALRYPKEKPPEWQPAFSEENYERDRSGRYVCRFDSSAARDVQRAFWFRTDTAAALIRRQIRKPYLEIIRVEIRVEET